MKKSYFFLVIFSFIFLQIFVGQTINHTRDLSKKIDIFFDKDSINGFNEAAAWQQALNTGAPLWEQKIFVASLKRDYIDTKYNLIDKGSLEKDGLTVRAACSNVDFETGTIAGWTLSQGLNSNSTTQGGCCPSATARYAVVGPGFDAAIPALATVPTGGGFFSLQLGDVNTTGGFAVKASQTFTVTAANSVFVYKYAVAMEDGGHSCTDQPYFNISFVDCSNNPIPCGAYNVVPAGAGCATGGDPSFQTYTDASATTFVWKDWTTKSFDLSAYIGQCVTIKFIASDCVPKGHPCWAYIDCACQPMTLNLNGTDIPVGQLNTIFCTATTNTLCAPVGFNSYSWTGPGVTGQTTQCINIATNGTYSVTLGQAGASCSSPVLYSTFTIVPNPSVTIAYTTTACQNNLVVPFQSVVNLNGGPAITTYSWDCDGDGTIDYSTANASNTYTAAGTYTTELTISNGYCTSTATQVISVQKTPTVTIANSSSVCPGACLTLSGSALQTNTITNATVAISSFTWAPAVTSGGATLSPTVCPASTTIYTLTGTASNGCTASNTVLVTVNPKPSASLTYTNPTCGTSNGIVLINNTTPALPAQTVLTFTSNLGTVSGQTVTGLGASSPIITLANNFGCTFTISPTLTMTPGPTAISTSTTSSTCGNSNGSFTFGSPTGGTAAYTYAINNGPFSATSPTTNLAAGNYSVTVKDANGCLFLKTIVISNIPGPTALAGTTGPASCAGPTGSYTVTGVTGGTPTYSYSIDGGPFATTSVFSGLSTGTHSITVEDANGCTFPTTFSVGLIAGITSASVNSSPANCGGANGTATVVSVTGGVPAYTYSFDGGGFSANTSPTIGLAAGNHTVVIMDVNSCTLTVPYTVLSLGSPSTSVSSYSNITCNGGSNGSFTVDIPTGGSGAPFTYTLTNPYTTFGPSATNASFSGLTAGTYNIIVKDVAGCVSTTSVVLTEPTSVSVTPTAISAKCFGTATGTINVTGSGGTPGYTYNLNGGAYQNSTVFANQISATYIMGIKDSYGCLGTQTVVINEPPVLGISTLSQNANCTAANGFITATVSGGTPVYTYTWTGGGGSAATSNNLIAGNYTVTATDANGCVISSPATIGVTPGGTGIITASTNVTCNGLCNGNLTAGMVGGAAPFTYSWSPGGQTTQTAINLCPGTYTCTIIDFYGCFASAVGTVTQPPVLTAIMNSNNVKCFGTSTGTVSAAGTGGTSPYTYLWPTLASTLATVPNVAIGTYSCSITDANNCVITSTILVTQPSSITLTSTITAANCNQANGSASINATGGTPAYTYSWSSGATTTSQSGLLAGTYLITVKDANNCSEVLAVTIPNLSGPTVSVPSQTNVNCFGGNNGSATLVAAGGVTPYVYAWSNGQATPTANNLVSGIYTVSVTDSKGCIASVSVNITQPTALTLTISPNNPKCFGALNGFGIAAAIGGTAPYTYTWTGGAGNLATSNALGAGNYGVSSTDANGCVVTSSMSLVNPPVMIASASFTNVSCYNLCNGMAVGTSTNGVGAVSYSWLGGSNPISTQLATGLCAGTYTMIATDQNNCTGSSIVTITQPSQLFVTIPSSGSVTCNGGNNGYASATPSGGTPGYTYTWTPSGGNAGNANSLMAGNYTVSVTDSKLCTATANVTILQPTPVATTLTTSNIKCNGGSDGTANVTFAGGTGLTTLLWQPGLQSGNFVNNLSAGNQTVTITTNGSCKTILTFTLTQPAALLALITATNSNCSQANGAVCATVGGGTAPLSYLWSNGITTLCNKNIVGGAYTFTVTDANLCKTKAGGLVNDIAGPLVAVTGQTNVTCFGGNDGAATTTITGGVTPYNIFWSANPSLTQNVSNFTAGLNIVTVLDAAGCVGTAMVNITQPPALVSAIGSFSNVTCNGLNNGQATMLVNGGTPNYNYLWTPSAQTSPVLINAGANTYTCVVIDANGCKTSKVVKISQPLPLVMTNSIVTNILCFGDKNGQISTTTQGGTPGYNYVWSPPQTNSGVLGGLSIGPYSVVITDAQNCSINANFNILEPSLLTSTSLTLVSKCGLSNGSSTVTASGGTANYGYTWNTSTPQSGSVAVNMAPGNYICTITDANGCLLTQPVSIFNASSPIISSFVTTPPLCFGQQNGSIVVNYIGGTPNYDVVWASPISQTLNTSALSATVVGVGVGSYGVTITDSYGCVASNIVQVSSPPFLSLTASASQTICLGQTAQIYGTGGGGTPPYTYTWTPTGTGTGPGPLTVKPNLNAVYTVSMSDSHGCSPAPKIVLVNVTPPLAISGYSITKCDGDKVLLSPIITSPGNGGTSPLGYTYNWNTGASTSSIIVTASVITTPNTYTVNIDDHCTIPLASAVFTVNANPLPVISFTASPIIGCGPLTVTLTGSSNGVNDIFSWQELGLVGNPEIITLTDTGNIAVTLLVTNPLTGCINRVVKQNYIHVYPPPIASFYADPQSTSILDPTINFVNTSVRNVTNVWDFGDPVAIIGTNNSYLKDPSHTYSLTGQYRVNLWVTSLQGCTDNAAITVEVTPDFVLYIPNCFTPDGNGKNDFFQPVGVGIDVDNYRMDIFDRWGEEIFTSNNFYKGWDGTVKGGDKIAAQGVYTYKIVVFDILGNKHPLIGHVTLLKQHE